MLRQMLRLIVARNRLEDGQALAEYGLVLAVVTIGAIVFVTALGVIIATTLGDIAIQMP
jgi:Flp pilus assembly pilin Flp